LLRLQNNLYFNYVNCSLKFLHREIFLTYLVQTPYDSLWSKAISGIAQRHTNNSDAKYLKKQSLVHLRLFQKSEHLLILTVRKPFQLQITKPSVAKHRMDLNDSQHCLNSGTGLVYLCPISCIVRTSRWLPSGNQAGFQMFMLAMQI